MVLPSTFAPNGGFRLNSHIKRNTAITYLPRLPRPLSTEYRVNLSFDMCIEPGFGNRVKSQRGVFSGGGRAGHDTATSMTREVVGITAHIRVRKKL